MMNCNFYILNPGGSGSTSNASDTFTYSFQTNSTIRFPQYLRTLDGAYSNTNPLTLSTSCILTKVSLYTKVTEQDQFAVEIVVNNVSVLTFSKPSGTDSITIATSYALAIGDRVAVRVASLNGDIDIPNCTLTFTVP